MRTQAVLVGALLVGVCAGGCSGQAQAPSPSPAQTMAPAPQAERGPAAALYKLEDAFLRWPMPVGAEAYAAIDGKRIHRYVVEQAEIARRYRDQGHPQFWGRITGTSSDAESAEWLAAKYKAAGLTDIRLQPIDLVPQWLPKAWELSVAGGTQTLKLETAQPAYRSPGTTGTGLDLELVYAGLGSEADFVGRDVRGKAVLIFSMPRPMTGFSGESAARRAEAKGAAAVIDVFALPGNLRYQSYPANTKIPTFNLGREEGMAVRDLMTAGGAAPRLKLRMDVETVPNLKTSLVWGTLPGASDEKIYIIAHRDGWFDAAGDNASGVASMVALAEYYAKIPVAKRRRTIVFVGLDGHHNSGEGAGAGREWMVANRNNGMFAKTALMINCEHPSTVQTYTIRSAIRWGNTYTAQEWYAGGPNRPKLQDIAIKAFREFGVPTYAEPERQPPAGDLGRFFWFLPGVATSDFNHYFHTDGETPETVPWTGLEASTRAYARIIDGVNGLELSDLQRPEDPDPRAPRPTTTTSPGR